MKRLAALLLAAPLTAGAHWSPFATLQAEVSSTDTFRCTGACDRFPGFKDHTAHPVSLSAGSFYTRHAVHLGASADFDYGTGLTVRARLPVTEQLALGAGLGARERYLSSARTAFDRTPNSKKLAPYASLEASYGPFFIRASYTRAEFALERHPLTGFDQQNRPTFGPVQRVTVDHSHAAWQAGVSIAF